MKMTSEHNVLFLLFININDMFYLSTAIMLSDVWFNIAL